MCASARGIKMDRIRRRFRMNYTDASNGSSGSSDTTSTSVPEDEQTSAERATERVAFLVGEDLETPDLFCQMDVLRTYKEDLVWKEMARWVKYEEAVEEGGQRWSKPHVASLMMEALQDLQHIMGTCPVLLDSTATNMAEVVDEVTTAWLQNRMFAAILQEQFKALLLKRHKYQFYMKSKDTKKKHHSTDSLKHLSTDSLKNLQHDSPTYINGGYEKSCETDTLQVPNMYNLAHNNSCPDSPSLAMGARNKSFLRKIPSGSEVVNLLVGEIEELDKVIAAFVRLQDASNVGDITEVQLDTRFMFIIFGPKDHLGHCAEICRCMATLFTDEIFRCVAFRAENRQDLISGIQEFCLHLTVLPPGCWDPSTRIEPPDATPSQEYRKTQGMTPSKSMVSLHSLEKMPEGEVHEEEGHIDPTLIRTGKLFGGLIQDVRRKLPYYPSDFKDALHVQCVASFFFLFLATLTPNVTFGGLLGQATDQYMGTMECILSAAISGVLFALFSGQPLNILGSTGPMLVLEGILYRFCKDQDWDFMPFRCWVGFWTGLFIFLVVMFDLSALVRYITRFTEESFACLIALIFIYQAFKKVFEIGHIAPVHLNPPENPELTGCYCILPNSSFYNLTGNIGAVTESPLVTSTLLSNSASSTVATFTTTLVSNLTTGFVNITSNGTGIVTANVDNTGVDTQATIQEQCELLDGILKGVDCPSGFVADVFFFSLILFFGTFFLATVLVDFRHSLFFPMWVRQNVSDFAVLIAIVIMVLIDANLGIPTPKLLVPREFKPTKPGRPWLINPISDKNPWWLMLLSAVPAVLAVILIFMDQQITAVIVNRRENKLKKGSGYHLDMLVVGVLVIVLSILGLPWYVAATVTALAHVMSLKKVSECTAPGEKPVFLGVREQRVTGLLVGIFSGLAVLITSVLSYIPMPVLYGVFLYMGVAPLGGMQLIQRILLVFMPAKYQPDYSYIRKVPIRRVHLFTAIQVFCLAILWVVKSIQDISIAFPLMVLIICFVRKALDKCFTQRELKWIDDILPATSVKREEPKELVKIHIDTEADDEKKNVDSPTKPSDTQPNFDPAKGTTVDDALIDHAKRLQKRMSVTFMCKTDLDAIKANAPDVITDRRKSLIMAVERKRSLQMLDGTPSRKISTGTPSRKISAVSMGERKKSHDHKLQHGNTPSIVHEHNKLNKMLSLPATIADENETENGNGQDSPTKDKK